MRISWIPVLACAAVVCGSAFAGYYDALRIVTPRNGDTVHSNSGRVMVIVDVEPPLRADVDDRIVVSIDGRTVASTQEGRIALAGVDRGEHTLQAKVVSTDGATVVVSAPIIFYMWHASRLFPNRTR
jgi:hypothetical protein